MTAKTPKRKTAKKKTPKAPPRRSGRPSLWDVKDALGKTLEERIIATITETGCSFKDAAEINHIAYDTLKARQRDSDSFSSRLSHARLSVKTRTLGYLHLAAAAGNVRAQTFYLERVYRDEFGPRLFEDGSAAAAAAAAAAAEAEFRADTEFGDQLRADGDALAAIERIARAATAQRPSPRAARAGVPGASPQSGLPDGAAPAVAQPRADRRRRRTDS